MGELSIPLSLIDRPMRISSNVLFDPLSLVVNTKGRDARGVCLGCYLAFVRLRKEDEKIWGCFYALMPSELCRIYTEAKVDVTQEIEQRAQWYAPAWAACCTLFSISCVQS